MSAYCPTQYKEAYASKGVALRIAQDMQRRSKRTKRKYSPVEPYDCRCGSVHLTTKR